MQILNNDFESVFVLWGEVSIWQGRAVEIICIDYVTLSLQKANPWELTLVPEL